MKPYYLALHLLIGQNIHLHVHVHACTCTYIHAHALYMCPLMQTSISRLVSCLAGKTTVFILVHVCMYMYTCTQGAFIHVHVHYQHVFLMYLTTHVIPSMLLICICYITTAVSKASYKPINLPGSTGSSNVYIVKPNHMYICNVHARHFQRHCQMLLHVYMYASLLKHIHVYDKLRSTYIYMQVWCWARYEHLFFACFIIELPPPKILPLLFSILCHIHVHVYMYMYMYMYMQCSTCMYVAVVIAGLHTCIHLINIQHGIHIYMYVSCPIGIYFQIYMYTSWPWFIHYIYMYYNSTSTCTCMYRSHAVHAHVSMDVHVTFLGLQHIYPCTCPYMYNTVLSLGFKTGSFCKTFVFSLLPTILLLLLVSPSLPQ